jgi:hypothetical protein
MMTRHRAGSVGRGKSGRGKSMTQLDAGSQPNALARFLCASKEFIVLEAGLG